MKNDFNDKYTRHTSSCLGVAGAHTGESHSLSMLIDGLKLCADKQLELFWVYMRRLFLRPKKTESINLLL